MTPFRAAFTLSGLLACLVISGLSLYSVNAGGAAERVVDGYAVATTAAVD